MPGIACGGQKLARRVFRLPVMAGVLAVGVTTLVVGAPAFADVPDILDIDDVLWSPSDPVVDVAFDVDSLLQLDMPTFNPTLDLGELLQTPQESSIGDVINFESESDSVQGSNLPGDAASSVPAGMTLQDAMSFSPYGAAYGEQQAINLTIGYYEKILAEYASMPASSHSPTWDAHFANIQLCLDYLRGYGVGTLPPGGIFDPTDPNVNPWIDPFYLHSQVEEITFKFIYDVFIFPLYTIGTWISGATGWLQPIASWGVQMGHNIATSIADGVVNVAFFFMGR